MNGIWFLHQSTLCLKRCITLILKLFTSFSVNFVFLLIFQFYFWWKFHFFNLWTKNRWILSWNLFFKVQTMHAFSKILQLFSCEDIFLRTRNIPWTSFNTLGIPFHVRVNSFRYDVFQSFFFWFFDCKNR